MELENLKFWMVYGLGSGRPTYRHETEDSAVEEAKRLARQCPGVDFFVLESTHRVKKYDVDVTKIGSIRGSVLDDGIPF